MLPSEHPNDIPPSSSESAEETLHWRDSELFIRRTFEQAPEEGFTLLFRHYYVVLCNHATRFVWSKDVAKDLVSDVFFNFWKNRDFTTVNTSYRAYLFRAVRNASYNYLTREMSRRAPLEALENWDAQTIRPDQTLHFDELQHKIETAISQLPPQCKRVFLLSRFEGKKYADIADELGVSVKAVEMHISKALHHLRTVLKEEWLPLLLLAVLWG